MKAYPFSHKHPTLGTTSQSEGMDLRDYFASQVLPKLMGTDDMSVCVKNAYRWADEMIKARENKDE